MVLDVALAASYVFCVQITHTAQRYKLFFNVQCSMFNEFRIFALRKLH
jgi:hypothetical protein